jgi:HD-like signal output (HDOD) protein
MSLKSHLAHELPAPHFPAPYSFEELQILLDLISNDETDLRMIVEAMEARPAIASRVEREVNSVGLGSNVQIRTLRHAITVLGMRRVRDLLLDLRLQLQMSLARRDVPVQHS